ncbi:MAG: YraN family protein [Bacteroidales bacterium]|nr:YraN family protein [Bacteroidales bacterium]
MKTSIQKGREGEELAVKLLQEKGYRILETNWRFRHKEIDIIATRDNEIVFVEVKTRKNADYGYPEEAVNKRKQRYITDAAEAYIISKDLDLEARFDVIAILGNKHIRHYEYAFYPGL